MPHFRVTFHQRSRGSYYIRRFDTQTKQELGIYLELWLSVENKGDRAATVKGYDLRIDGLGEFKGLHPEPQREVRGRNVTHALNPVDAVNSYIEVPAERMVPHRRIPFMLNVIAPLGVRQIRCELTIEDTEGTRASLPLAVDETG